jgi:hypothetical protein
MNNPERSRSLVFALYLNAAIFFAILLVLISRNGSAVSMAQAAPAPAMAGGDGIYVMPAQYLQNVWGCYVLDTQKQTLCAYAFYGNSQHPELRLIASRGIAWDRQLTNYNTGPDPESIRKMVQLGEQPLRGVHPQATQPADKLDQQ